MLIEAYFALCHVASQIVYRWLPPPRMEALQSPETQKFLAQLGDATELHALPLGTWRDILRFEAERDARVLTWLPAYLESRDHGGESLAVLTFDHCRHIREAGGVYLTLANTRYPALLRMIADPPLGLSICGNLLHLERPIVSVVGSRKASGLAIQESFALGRELAIRGFAVASGGAFGCDIAAHQGVLAAATPEAAAIVVFACGLEKLYPRHLAPIFRRLAERRAIFLSERLWRASCRPWDFAARNRIIAGLSRLTVVMQAAARSGALITANLALDQGRDVAVLAHPPTDVRGEGSQQLLADGAWSFGASATLLEVLGFPTQSGIDAS